MTDRRVPAVRGTDLRIAMERVADGYLRFLDAGPEPGTDDDTKAFAAHHAACRAALAHLEHLLKVARAMGAEGAEVEEATTILVEAREALAQFEEEEESPDATEEHG